MKIRFLLPARRELNEVVAFYNRERRGLGNDFRDEAWETLHRIMNFPLANGIHWVGIFGGVKCIAFPTC